MVLVVLARLQINELNAAAARKQKLLRNSIAVTTVVMPRIEDLLRRKLLPRLAGFQVCTQFFDTPNTRFGDKRLQVFRDFY